MQRRIVFLVVGLSVGLLFMGALRFSATQPNILTPLSAYATTGYVVITVLFTILLLRSGLPLNRFGFGLRLDIRQVILALVAVAILRSFNWILDPLIEGLLGARNLSRFSEVENSTTSLVGLLITNWTLAAFGEEFAYRIVLLRGLSYVFGDSQKGLYLAVGLQAVMFGLIHAYQGPAGIVGATVSGLVFGAVTIAGRWSIWPAALAHGTNNTIGIIALNRAG